MLYVFFHHSQLFSRASNIIRINVLVYKIEGKTLNINSLPLSPYGCVGVQKRLRTGLLYKA